MPPSVSFSCHQTRGQEESRGYNSAGSNLSQSLSESGRDFCRQAGLPGRHWIGTSPLGVQGPVWVLLFALQWFTYSPFLRCPPP